MLTVFESLFVLALDDDLGNVIESLAGPLETILAGAVLAELALQKRIDLRGNRAAVIYTNSTGHPILDRALFDILESTRPRKVRYWLNHLAYKKIVDEIGHQLVEKGVLVRKKKRLYLSIPYGENYNRSVSAQYDLTNRLRDVVLANQPPESGETALLAFLYYGDLNRLVFTRAERRAAQKKIQGLVSSEEEGGGLGDAVFEIIVLTCDPDGKEY